MASSQGPTSQDGSDAGYRMKVDDVYKDMAKGRRYMNISTKIQTFYILARSAWKFIPSFLTGTPLPITDLLILLGGVGSFFFYRYAFGYGRAQHEKLAAIMFSFLFNMVLMIECFLMFWLYHIQFGPQSIYPEAVAAYPPIPRSIIIALGLKGDTAESVLSVLDVFEKGLDVAGIASFLITVVVMRDYAISLRDLKRDQQSRREQGTKAE